MLCPRMQTEAGFPGPSPLGLHCGQEGMQGSLPQHRIAIATSCGLFSGRVPAGAEG